MKPIKLSIKKVIEFFIYKYWDKDSMLYIKNIIEEPGFDDLERYKNLLDCLIIDTPIRKHIKHQIDYLFINNKCKIFLDVYKDITCESSMKLDYENL